MADASALITLGAVVLGGGVSIAATLAAEAFKHRTTIATRWDADLARHASELVATSRRLQHVAGATGGGDDSRDAKHRLDTQHEALRSLAAQVGLLGSFDVQERARMVVRHAYAVRAVAQGFPDPRQHEYPGLSPNARLIDAISEFQAAVRRQLRIANADDVLDEAQNR